MRLRGRLSLNRRCSSRSSRCSRRLRAATHGAVADEPSYFPPVEQVTEAADETAGPAAESASAPEDPAPAQAEEEEAEVAEPEQVNEAAKPAPVPPPSVWGQKATAGGKTPLGTF